MVVGVCMINVELGKENAVRKEISRVDGIRELLHLFGEYDFIAILETEGLKSLNDTVDIIRTLKGVTSTKTIIGAEF
ncbi:asnC family protein [archaeon BMS3Abin16]|nr:asnC family protein [archaeon BMS3Abin16]HDY74117.1 Lrp/AsnC family transcriptional regulator [Euryarchaeota archaeon]